MMLAQPKQTNQHGKMKVRRLSNLEVGEFLIQNNIKRDTELFAVANSEKKKAKKPCHTSSYRYQQRQSMT